MKSIVLLIVGVVAPMFLFAKGVNLSDAISKRFVKMDAVSTAGKHTGKALRLKLTNNGTSSIEINVNTGIILTPADASFQQLVLPGGESVTLKAHETSELDVQIFCSNAVKLCPVAGMHYSYFRMSGEVATKILEYVKAHGLFDHLGQAAIWSVTNYLELKGVYDPNRIQESEKLIAHIVAVTKRDKPTYYATYEEFEQPGQRAYMGKASTIYVPFELNLTSPKAVTFAVYTATGQFVKNAADPQMVMTGKRTVTAELTPKDFETGKYLVRVMAGNNILQERLVLVEQPWITFKD